MNVRPTPPRAAAKWIVLASAIVAVGCPPSGGFPPPSHDWNTPLPSGVDSDAATFREKLAMFSRSGSPHIRARAATCRPSPLRSPRSFCAVDVKIEPVGNTLLIDPDNAPDPGVPVARIENQDTLDTEALFGFRPGIQAIYYLWVDRKPHSTKARWTIVEVPMGAGIVVAGYQKDLKLCHRPHQGEIRVSDADFYEYKYDDHPCDGDITLERSRFGEASYLPTQQLFSLARRMGDLLRGNLTAAQGEWISCSGGCCI
jgi:hypothetical protein